MATPKKTTADFNAIFNDLIGSRTGQVWDVKTGSPKPTKAGSIAAAKKYNRGKNVDFKDTAKQLEDAVNGSRNSPSESVDVTPNIEAQKAKELLDNFNKLLDNDSFFERNVVNRGKDLLGTVGELASRPIYAVSNAATKALEAVDQGEFPLAAADDALYGAWRGVSGQDKTTPGNFYEYATDPDVERNRKGLGKVIDFTVPGMQLIAANRELRRHAGTNNIVSRWTNRVWGFGGETVGDPMNLVGGKVVSVLAKGSDAGRMATGASRAGVTSLYDEVVDNAVANIPSIRDATVRGGTRVNAAGNRVTVGGTSKLTNKISNEIADQIDNSVLTPGRRAIAANAAVTVQGAVVRGTMTARTKLLSKFEKTLARIESGGLTVGSKEYDKLVKSDPILREFDDAMQNGLKNMNPQSMTREQVLKESAEKARSSIDDTLQTFGRNLEDELNASLYNTFALRVGAKNIPLKFLGKGYAAARSKAPGLGAPKAFSYGRQLPGKTGQAVGKARRIGHQNYENFLHEMRPIARKYGKEDRAAISRYIHNFTDPDTFADDLLTAPEHLREGIVAIKRDYDRILKEELEAGVRAGTDEVPFNYQYLHFNYDDFRPGAGTRRSAQEQLKGRGDYRGKGTRKAEVRNTGNIVTGPEQVKAMGLKPVDDPFEALAQRRLRSERLKSRSLVTDDFFRTYGASSGTMDARTADSLGLVKIASPDNLLGNKDLGYKINKPLQSYMRNTGESLYLPKDVADAFKNYIKLADVNTSEELSSYLRLYDKVLNTFKMSATIPFPGFHVKNMAGDIYMGYLDGVRSMDYTRFMRGSRSGTYKFRNGPEMSVEDFNTLFARQGKSGGFVETELFPSPHMAKNNVRGVVRSTGDKVRTASEIREDFGRKVHFFHALDEEFQKLGVKEVNPANLSRNAQKALDNASWRTDKFKFDYGALTSTEKAVMRRTIPFYTFLRKSAPVMLEGMLMNPSQYGKTYRFFGDEEGYGPRAAQWQRELGFAAIAGLGGDEDNPLLFPSNILPTDAITTWGKDPLSPGQLTDNFINSGSPFPKALLELAMGRSTFTGQELFDGEKPSALQQGRHIFDSIIPGIKTVEQDVVQPILKSTGLREDENVKGVMDDPWQRIFGSRLALGLGARRLDDESQRRNVNSEMGWYDQELKKYSQNLTDYGIKIFLSRRSGGNSIKVRTLDGKTTIYDGDLQGALSAVEQYTKNPRNVVKEGDEIVNYVDHETGKVLRNRPAREMTSLDRVLQF